MPQPIAANLNGASTILAEAFPASFITFDPFVFYRLDYSCEKERSWRLHTDTPEHYYIWTVLMGYQANHDAKQAYSALRKRGIDLRNTAEYTPSVQALLAEIYALAHENSRAKKAVVEAEETKAEEQVNNEAESQQE